MKIKRQLRIVAIHFSPATGYIFTERLPLPLPKGFTGGRRCRQYWQSIKRTFRLHDACMRAGWNWKQDRNGVHLEHPKYAIKAA